jgi:hypothetical protein
MAKAKTEVVVPPGRIWPDTPRGNPLRIDLIGVTGEQDSGKTCFLLGIAPGVHSASHSFAGKPRTLYLGLERSATTFAGTGAHKIEVIDLLAEKGMPPTTENLLNVVESITKQVAPGQYDCLAIDPISDLDSAKTDQITKHPEKFGLTKGMVERSGAGFKAEGIVWGKIKDAWKEWMLTIGQKFQCVAYSTHLRDEFKGKVNTGRREPKGKDTIWQVTTLGIWLSRDPSKSATPSGIVYRKDRLADTYVDESGELVVIPLLPPRLDVCTPARLRFYIANPPNYDRLKDSEKVEPEVISEVEMNRIRLATAEAQASAAAQQTALVDRQMELAAIRRQPAPAASQPPTTPYPQPVQQPTVPAAVSQEIDAKLAEGARLAAAAPQADKPAMPGPTERATSASGVVSAIAAVPSTANVERFKALIPLAGIEPAKLAAAMAAHGATRFTELDAAKQDALLAAMQKAADARAQAKN